MGTTYSGLAQQVSAGGQVGTVVTTPASGDSYTPQYASLYGGTGCVLAGSCVATGGCYNNSPSNSDVPYLVSFQASLAVSTSSLLSGSQGQPYSQALGASGAWGFYDWSVTSGSLPAGLSLDAQTGLISGTPTGSGTSTVTVSVSAPGASALRGSRASSAGAGAG
ncbi:MAG: Ig domain-containing protein [Solirubrobacteraceae bacterium]